MNKQTILTQFAGKGLQSQSHVSSSELLGILDSMVCFVFDLNRIQIRSLMTEKLHFNYSKDVQILNPM